MSTISRADDWDAEYDRKGMPSSFRNEPSGSLGEFLRILTRLSFSGDNAVDIGCGTGRNSITLAQAGYKVIGFDFAPGAVKRFIKSLSENPLKTNVVVSCHDVKNPWPVTDAWADIAIDTFCFKHQVPMKDRLSYITQLQRTLRVGGMYLLTLADLEDGYYSQFPHPELGENVIIDPENGIPSVLYSRAHILEIFKQFELVYYQRRQKPSIMHGNKHDRITHLFVLKHGGASVPD